MDFSSTFKLKKAQLSLLLLLSLISMLPPPYLKLVSEGGLRASWSDVGVHTVFYFYMPPGGPYIDFVGIHNRTNIWLFDITKEEAKLVRFGSVDRMKLLTHHDIRGGRYYKVIATKPVAVSIGGDGAYSFGYNTFYPSVEGSYVGKEFIFMAVPSGYREHVIFGIESSEVEVYDSAGRKVFEDSVPAYFYVKIDLKEREMYRISSSGNITVSTWSGNSIAACPSINGSFVGRKFFGVTIPWATGAFAVFAYEDSDVIVHGAATPYRRVLRRGEYWYQSGVGKVYLTFESSGDIAVWTGDIEGPVDHITYMGDDITFIGGREGKEFIFYAPHAVAAPGGAVIFAWKDTEVYVNETRYVLREDRYLNLKTGFYHVKANNTIIIQILGEDGVFNDWGTYLISSPELTVDYGKLPYPPWWEAYMPYIYGAAAVATLVTFMYIRRRGYRKIRKLIKLKSLRWFS